MKIKTLAILTATIIFGFTSCKKENKAPEINLTSVVDEQDFEVGDTIFIKGTASDDDALHELQIMLYQEESGDTVINWMPMVHDLASFTIDTLYIPADTSHVHFHLMVTAADHDNKTTEISYTLHWAD